MGYILTDTSPAYELVGDITVSSATTSVSFTGLNFTSADDLLLVSDIIRNSNNTQYYLYVNGNSTNTNYYAENLTSNGTSVIANRFNYPEFAYTEVGSYTRYLSNSNIKLTNSGYFTYQSKSGAYYGGTTPQSRTIFGTSTFTSSSITSLTISAQFANEINVGSRFRLYKLVAEKVADITISTATTSVDITGLSIDKGSEYMLVSDINNVYAGGAVGYYLQVNEIYNNTSYWSQRIQASSTSISSNRAASPFLASFSDPQKALFITNIKVTNNNFFVWQSSNIEKYQNGSAMELRNVSCTTEFNVTSVYALRINSYTSGAIGVGSRFQLYKLR